MRFNYIEIHRQRFSHIVNTTTDAGTGLRYGDTAPCPLKGGGNGGTGALTYQYHK